MYIKWFLCGNLSYNLSISCLFQVELIFKGANFTNGISIFNHEFVCHKILKNLDIFDMQNTQKIFKSKYTQHIPYTGCKLCPTNVSAWALKLPPSLEIIYLETGVFKWEITTGIQFMIFSFIVVKWFPHWHSQEVFLI